ncbi:TPA: heavy metal-binding domain-containing protein [Clostridioides difficile]|uniref:heavy metal-binding domain-containing protein n=1 Tax=Clostridioides difficile TaxID=1496 RepID=UPI000B040153|nr:heavy metal-binding domain-containing protein [Clostridioides difficile]EII6832789.1 heavy metal-binding domain-containing protein [Clostridioides difficile]EJA6610257.1 heavy metal-binding domain-containing protein [Clostridioides difficile]EKS6798213.1 heavy metal-binding domain-containing protein [Clostridioides difficile]MBF9871001.1 heavy metal-binding domain-containing protein [Clostridioides difficile]MBF9983750.1 heavy metal-binding domain-containing protein [Clostridioides difficil
MTEYIVVLNNLNNWDLKEFIDENNTYSIYSSTDKEMVIDYAKSLASSMKPSHLIIKDENNIVEKDELFLNNKCRKCGKQLPENSEQDLCELCKDILKIKAKESIEEYNKEKELNSLKSNPELVLISTTPFLDGYTIEKYITVEAVEVVVGAGFYADTTASLTVFLGDRSFPFEKKLNQGRTEAFNLLKKKAVSIGGNAVIGIDIDYMEIGKLFSIMVNGTVVKVKQNDK